MKFITKFFKEGAVSPIALTASAFLAIVAIFGISILPNTEESDADMYIELAKKVVTVGETFEVEVLVESKIPVNVFAGELKFDHQVLSIKSIDYNISVANLWAEKPWYSNGDGTLNFAGGTTEKGGFTGVDTLIKVTFETIREGEGVLTLDKPRILLHDGLGTDAKLNASIDTIIVIENESTTSSNPITNTQAVSTTYKVVEEPPSTDLNGDGKQSISDISIFMLNIASDDSKYDFNLDGKIDTKDLNIILGAE